MQNLIVIIIVGLAAAYVGRAFYKSLRGDGNCGCECCGCAASPGCDLHENIDSKQ